MVKIICPKCHHSDLHAYGTVSATLHLMNNDKGNIEINFLEWKELIEIDSYHCITCGHRFVNE